MPRTRLQPEARTRQLLDVAADIVVQHGSRALTMNALAEAAGVSKALVYNYIENRDELILRLFDEVSQLWTGRQARPSPEEVVRDRDPAAAFRDAVREYTDWYFDQLENPEGLLYLRLLAEPTLEERSDRLRQERHDENVRWWTRLSELVGMTTDEALVFSVMFNQASVAIWRLVADGAVSADRGKQVFYLSLDASFVALTDGEAAEAATTGRSPQV